MIATIAAAWAIARKDLLVETRSRTALMTAVLFAILVELIFVFSRPAGELALAPIAPSVLWVTVALSALLVLNRAFLLEREHAALDIILLAPISRSALFWGKWLANTVLVVVVLLFAFPLWVLFFSVPTHGLLAVFALAILAAVGFIAAGTLLAAITVRTRNAELLLPVLLLPFLIPPIFAGVSGSVRLMHGRPFSEISGWLLILLAYDVAFLTVSSLLFSFVVDD